MIPNSTWLPIGEYLPYPEFPVPKPSPLGDFYHIAIGPVVLGASGGSLTDKYWQVYTTGTQVFLGSLEDDYTFLFEASGIITSLQVTFDQVGRPLVVYSVNAGGVSLYWYDPTISDNAIMYLGDGQSVVTAFDIISNTSDDTSDVLVFYVKYDVAYMRVQRDRFAVEYPIGIEYPGLKLLSCGLNVGNRFQIEAVRDVGGRPTGFEWTPEAEADKDWEPEEPTEYIATKTSAYVSFLYPVLQDNSVTDNVGISNFLLKDVVKTSEISETVIDSCMISNMVLEGGVPIFDYESTALDSVTLSNLELIDVVITWEAEIAVSDTVSIGELGLISNVILLTGENTVSDTCLISNMVLEAV